MRSVKAIPISEAVDRLKRDPDAYFDQLRREAREKAERETDRRIAQGPRVRKS